MKSLALNMAKFDNCLAKLAVASSQSEIKLTDYGPYKHLPIITQEDLSAVIVAIADTLPDKLQRLHRKMASVENTERVSSSGFDHMCLSGYIYYFSRMSSATKALRSLSDEAWGLFNDISEAVDAISTWAESVRASELVKDKIRPDLWKEASNYAHQVVDKLSVFSDFANTAEKYEKLVTGRLLGMKGECSKEAIHKAKHELERLNIVQGMSRRSLTIIMPFTAKESTAVNAILHYATNEDKEKNLREIEQRFESYVANINASAEKEAPVIEKWLKRVEQ